MLFAGLRLERFFEGFLEGFANKKRWLVARLQLLNRLNTGSRKQGLPRPSIDCDVFEKQISGEKTMQSDAVQHRNLVDLSDVTDLNNLDAISLFGAFSPQERLKFNNYLDSRSYQPGEHVFSHGDLPAAIYILMSGSVDLVVDRDAVAHIESKYRPGQTFGESAFLGIQPHVGMARVASPDEAKVLLITRDALLKLQAEDGSLFALLMMNLAREVSRKYQSLLSKNVAKRAM